MKILHTADWYVGQLFLEYARIYEHQQFFNWLLETLIKDHINVLLISDDVFDLFNPSAASVKMFITAGNHDSASRLESPKPLLESSSIHIVGLIEKDQAGAIDYSKIAIPLKDMDGNTKAWCIDALFLKMGDYSIVTDGDNPYTECSAAFYKEAYKFVTSEKEAGQAIITALLEYIVRGLLKNVGFMNIKADDFLPLNKVDYFI